MDAKTLMEEFRKSIEARTLREAQLVLGKDTIIHGINGDIDTLTWFVRKLIERQIEVEAILIADGRLT